VKFFVRVSFEVSSFAGFFQHRIEPVLESTPMMSTSWVFMVGFYVVWGWFDGVWVGVFLGVLGVFLGVFECF